MLDLPVRETVRRKTPQTEEEGDGHGDLAEFREATGAFSPSEDLAGVASDRGMLGDARVRHGAGVRESRQRTRLLSGGQREQRNAAFHGQFASSPSSSSAATATTA